MRLARAGYQKIKLKLNKGSVMSDGIEDVYLSKEVIQESSREERVAGQIQSAIAKSIGDSMALCEELPTPECFPHQGTSLFVEFQDLGRDISVHVSPAGSSDSMVTVSRDILIPSDISAGDIEAITKFIGNVAYQNIFEAEDSE